MLVTIISDRYGCTCKQHEQECPHNYFDSNRLLKLLDRYILKQFFLATVVSLVGFIVLYIAIDMMEKLDKFLDKQVPAMIVAEYYLNFTPQIIALILPVGLLLGSLFATGKMSTQNEIVSMRSAGMSLYRFMAPFVISALLVSLSAVYFNGWILPRANARVLDIQRKHLHENETSFSQFNLHLQESGGRIVAIQTFNVETAKGDRISIEFFEPQKNRLVKRIDAVSLTWDSTKQQWLLHQATERTFSSGTIGDSYRALPENTPIAFSFGPRELRERQLRYEEMTNPELRRRIDLAKRAGQETARDEVDYYSKYSMSFTSLVVVLFGVSFASKKKRGGLSFEFSIAIFIAFIYLAFTKVSQTFGYSGQINPILTAWLANGLFLLFSLGVIAKAQK